MRIPIIVTVAALASVAVPGWAQKGRGGDAIFQEMCVGCHGTDGRADTDMGKKVKAADLTADDVQKRSDSELIKVIKNGQKKMPSFADKLSDDDIKAVVGYVKQLGKSK
ncbi:MAG TPA: cytochrome c [Bryobacteraceae bacterium]|nr:cytochrome c [Bryobacteraceae bacterium]